jgi:hypothetical protein
MYRSIITALNNNAVGLALSCPAISGAVPWTYKRGATVEQLTVSTPLMATAIILNTQFCKSLNFSPSWPKCLLNNDKILKNSRIYTSNYGKTQLKRPDFVLHDKIPKFACRLGLNIEFNNNHSAKINIHCWTTATSNKVKIKKY